MAQRKCWFSANCVEGIHVSSFHENMMYDRSRIKSPHRGPSCAVSEQSGEAQRWCLEANVVGMKCEKVGESGDKNSVDNLRSGSIILIFDARWHEVNIVTK